MRHRVLVTLLAVTLSASAAQAETICTAIAEASTGKVLLQHGDCNSQVTPASTFKVAASLMGFDSGFLEDEHSPTLAFRDGDPDWGGAAWREPTDPTRWIKYSVVWFTQRITHALGQARVEHFVQAFNFGNADISGDPEKHNGLDRAWLGSSLKISPLEQVAFLERLVNRQLPVSAHAFDMTMRITEVAQLPGGWDIHGKTGTGYPRDRDGNADEAHGYGWFVGWATKGDRALVFARLVQDEQQDPVPAGPRARDAFLNEFPGIASSLVQ